MPSDVDRLESRIIPLARHFEDTGRDLPWVAAGDPLRVHSPGFDGKTTLNAGLGLLETRIRGLGAGAVRITGEAGTACLRMERVLPGALLQELQERAPSIRVSAAQLEQAYILVVRPDGDKAQADVILKACTSFGLYHALVTLSLLAEPGPEGVGAVLPEVTVADWPDVAHRLAKSAALNIRLGSLEALAEWLPLLRLNMLALQYHGRQSRHPESEFLETVATLCRRLQTDDRLQTVIYFCPFRTGDHARDVDGIARERPNAFDFRDASDRDAYAALVRQFLEWGADGIEVDYNDWMQEGDVAMADVLNLACGAAHKVDPDAWVLYCPPSRGAATYRGPASPALRATLDAVPPAVATLWTGNETLLDEGLAAEDIRRWTADAGRAPWLWVNRVMAEGEFALSRPVSWVRDVPGARVFRGEVLPRTLGSLTRGVHLNVGLHGGYQSQPEGELGPRDLEYLLTVSDFLWNPEAWHGRRSWLAAHRAVPILHPARKGKNSGSN